MLRLQQERERRGWTRAYVSWRTRIHVGDYGKVEKGTIHAWPRWRMSLADLFQVPENELFQEVMEVAPDGA